MYNHQPLCPFNVFSIPVIAKTLASQIAPIPITLSCFVHGWRIKIIPGKTYENVANVAKVCKFCRSRQELSSIYLQKSASIQTRKSLLNLAKNEPTVTVRKS